MQICIESLHACRHVQLDHHINDNFCHECRCENYSAYKNFRRYHGRKLLPFDTTKHANWNCPNTF